MKLTQHEVDTNQSCSCTSCLYGTDSDRASLKRVKAGSRIDKLYFSKYLPLREKKLLDKLVKTRAVYDDVRNQLLSESSNSIDSKANLKPRKRLPVSKTDKEHDYTEKSSDIFELVDLVDKGVLLGQKKISECCSCCSCRSKIRLQEHRSKGLRHRHAGGHVSSKSSAVSRQRMAHDLRLDKHVRYAKHIKSDPCTCTLQFSDLSKHNLKTTIKRMHHEQPQPVLESLPFQESSPTPDTKSKRRSIIQSSIGEANKKTLVKCACKVKDNAESGVGKSLEKLIATTEKNKQKLEPSTKKSIKSDGKKQEQVELSSLYIKQPALGEISRRTLVKCACKVKENIELGAMKSFEKIKDTKEKVMEKVEASIRKSVQRENLKQIPIFEPDNAITVRKDSLTVYKKQIERKRQLKDWVCDFECFPEECVPEECYRIKKRRKPNSQVKSNRTENQRKIIEAEASSASDANVQAYNVKKTMKTATKSQKSGTRKTVYNLREKSHISLELGTKNKESLKSKGSKPGKRKKLKPITCTCKEITSYKPSNTAHKTKFLKSLASLQQTTYPLVKKPTTDVLKVSRSLIKTDKMTKASKSKTGTTKLSKASRNPIGIVGHMRDSNSDSDLIQNSRQAVRIGSSFSFNIEFYKDKPITKIPIETQKLPSKGKTQKSHYRHRGSGTSQRQTITNTQTGEYALKRCFCTLKLKAKGTKSKINKSFSKEKKPKGKSDKASTQTNQESSVVKEISVVSPMPDFRSYECEPTVCIPGSCSPKDCEQLIKNRVIKQNSIRTNTNKNKSTSSVTSKSITDLTHKKIQAAENTKINRPEKQRQLPQTPSVIPLNDKRSPQKQVVRVGSSFSFDIEFTKKNLTNNLTKIDNETVKLRGNKNANVKKEKNVNKTKSIQHQLSQVSSSTTKSRYSSAKHKLRKCFCTLGLSKPGNKKKREKTLSRGTLTESKSIKQIRHVNPSAMTKAMEVEENKNLRKRFKQNLLPYECEPGACVPGKCNPHECKEIITKRQAKLLKDHTKPSNTEYRRTRSTYSFTPKSKNTKAQKLQYTSPMPISKVKKKFEVPSGRRSITNSPNRQAVRIGSNFSFNVEFYKDVSPSNYSNPIRDELEPSKGISTSVKNPKYNSTQVQKKRRSILIGPALKRCFCTLKLQKPGKHKIKSNYISTGTETAHLKEDMYPKSIKATKSTKTKKMFSNVKILEPFECEPFICIPGECDPNKCLEIIKRRDIIRQSQELGVSTEHVMKKSTASITHKSKAKVKDGQSYTDHQNSRTKKRRQIKYSIPNHNSENPLRQAVVISSNFSFNVEFFKSRISGDVVSKEILKTKPKIVKTEDEKSFKTLVSQHKSQSVKIKKNHKASGVEHVLKRCFCTLKLQNKVKQQDKQNKTYMRPFVTTAMPIQIYMNRMNVMDNNNMSYLPVPLKETNINNNNMIYHHYNRDYTNTRCNKENAMIMNSRQYTKNRSVKYTESLFAKIHENKSQLIGLNPFLRSCFCTMNIQVEKSVKKSHKLKPYECEPGICVPDECDPYACQKLIMKRLMNKVSTMTGTKIKSISSGTTPLSLESKAKKSQYATKIPKDENEQRSTVKYVPPLPQRQAVRVGSNFNFNIELYKDRLPSASTSDSHNKPPKLSTSTKHVKHVEKKLKSRGTKGFERNPFDKSSQSEVKMQNRAASVTPILKKCFCTLKLQKKGTQNNAINLHVLKRKTRPPNTNNQLFKVKTTETGQNTNSQKPQTRLLDLNPYECEPLVCIPGECDPYKCLELIHKRNKNPQTRDYGTASTQQKKRSSLTTQRSRQTKKKQTQARNIVTKPGYSTKPVDEIVIKPARQAVRIGSSCSFNIEFYKDRSPFGSRYDVPNLPQHYIKNEQKTIKDSQKHPLKELKKFAEHSSQDSTSVHHRDSQVKSLTKRVKSTKTTSFIKRCFCTAKLHGADESVKADTKVKQNPKDSPSFLRKCLCKLKSITVVKEKPRKTANTGTEPLIRTEKFIKQNTHNHAHGPQILEAYECEPGVCIPGECDPYVCEKIIKKRKAKLHTKMSITDSPEKKSMSTNYKYPKASKGILTHSKEKKVPKEAEILLKEPRKQFSKSPQRNAVRIGSNFSFDIEFYKNKKSHLNKVQKAAATLEEIPKESISHKIKASPKMENKALTSNYMSLRSRKLQVNAAKKENKASGIGPMLKRCFCTLKLHNQSNAVTDGPKKERKKKDHADTSRFVTKGTETSNLKELPKVVTKQAMTYKLEPYECEPNICIPGECNPYECEKRIRKRLRESATSTQKRKMNSTKSMISNAYKSKDRTQQLNVKHKNNLITNNGNHERVISLSQKPKKSKNVDRPSRQAVRIGSSFSFDIEFFKNKEVDDSPKSKAPVPQKEVIKDRYTNQLSTHSRNRKSQHSKSVRHMDSQVLHKKVRSKMSQVAPFLKRCFCTLKLHKPDINPISRQSVAITTNEKLSKLSKVDDIRQKSRDKNQPHSPPKNIDPYECEPGVCVPGQCDPVKCEELIKKRKKEMHSKLSGTVGSKDQSTTSRGPTSYSFKHKTSQENPYVRKLGNRKTGHIDVSTDHQDLKPTKDSHRTAVRVGSSFSFDIEFYKEKASEGPQDIKSVADIKSEKKNKKESKLKNVTTDHRVSLRHRNSQFKEVKKESKGFGVEPLLKRCFCTLKFQKVGKLQQSPIEKLEPKVKDSSVAANMKGKQRNDLMRNAGSDTKKNHDLKPYECEPYICIPGECDPFECEKRIKRRHLKELGTGTKRPSMKSISTLSRDGNKLKTKKNQAKGDIHKQRKVSINKDPNLNRFSHNLHTAQISKPANRQAVRIGSNFSFNIEFYKEGSQNYNQIINDNNKALKGKSEVSMSQTKSIKSSKRKLKSQASRCKECCTKNRKQQVADLQKVSRGSGMAPALKRCFCTLTLQNKDIQNMSNLMSTEPKAANVPTRNKTTLTKAEPFFRNLDPYECEPGICVPGECNPYKCEDLIKKRNVKRRSKKSGTRRHSRVSVGSAAGKSTLTSKSKRVQHDGIGKRIKNESMIVEQPRFPVIRDGMSNTKQAVRIGSNFSFNIEFYKEKIPKAAFEITEHSYGKRNQYSNREKVASSKSASDKIKMTNTNICKLKNCKMQAQCLETRNRASAVDHALKRCFCTLKLHKPNLPNYQTQRPNVITVGRVDKIKTTSPFLQSQSHDQKENSKSLMKNNKSSPCSFICMTSTKDTKTVATKINKKYLAPDSLHVNQHVENQEKNSRYKRNNDSTDMKTILPYTPRKFNKNVSKTLLPETKKEKNVSFDKKCLCCQKNLNQEDYTASDKKPRSISNNNGKIKFGKGRGKTIEIKETNEKPNLRQSKPKGFLCRCIQLFSKQNSTRSTSNECPFEPPNCQIQLQKKTQKDILKTSKSERRRPITAQNTVPKKSKSLKMAILSEKNKSQENKHYIDKTKKYSRFQSGDAGQNEVVPVENQGRNLKGDSLDKKCNCLNCQARQSKIQNKIVKFTVIPKAKGNFGCTSFGKQGNVSKNIQQKNIEVGKSNYFGSFGKCFCTNDNKIKQNLGISDKFNKNQIDTLKVLTDTHVNTCNKSLKKERRKDKDLGGQKKLTYPKYAKKIKAQKSKGCCPCQESVNSKIKKSSKESKPTARTPNKLCLCSKSVKTCLCGSGICGKESKNIVLNTMEPRKPCVCGSVTCARIAKKKQSDMYICECGKKGKKEKNIKQMKQHKEYLKRQKKYQKEDRARKIKRLKANAKMLQDVIKYKNSSDVVLAAESAFDIAKLGCTTLVDLGRSTFRTVTDPKHTYESLKTSVRDPKRACIGVKSAISDSGVGGTYKRVKLRFGAMSCMKQARSKLEGCALTNYLIHMVEANPKKRMKRKPKKRKREQLDFGCSLFMSSLRKKPFLYVYNTCPWFYPHCLSMLNIWKQFSDLMLFLLAVVFWSPCIVCMEGCRAMMCCFLCTG